MITASRHSQGTAALGRLTAAIAVALAAIVFSSCSGREWTEFRGNGGLGQGSGSIDAPIAVKWQLLMTKQPEERRLFNQPLLLDDTIYFGSADGNFYSFDLNSGYMNWTFRSGGPINSVATADSQKVYFGSSDGIIYALSRDTGEIVWQYQTRGQVNSTVIGHEDLIIAAADADAVYFLTRDGELERELDNAVWHRNSFQVFDDVLAFSPGSDVDPYSLSVYDIEQDYYLWSLEDNLSEYYWFSFPAVKNRRLYFSVSGLVMPIGWEHYFAAMDIETGELIWDVRDPGYLAQSNDILLARDYLLKNSLLLDYGAPLVWRNQVIFAMGDQLLRSYRGRDGAELWKQVYHSPVSTAPTLAGDRIYFGLEAQDGRGYLVCASPRDGSIIWEIEVDGTPLNSPVIAGSWIVFGTDEGVFYVLEEVL